MGLFDNWKDKAFGLVKDVAKGTSSYIEEIERQAAERERQKKEEAEKENQKLQELEAQKQKILDEIAEEKRKLEEERERLAKDRADPSFRTPKKKPIKAEEESLEEESLEEESLEEESSEYFEDDIFLAEDEGALYPGTAEEDHGTLLDQLADMTAQQNELVRRCQDAGVGERAQEIVGAASDGRELYAVDLDDLGALSFTAKSVTRQFRAALELMTKAMLASGDQREQLMKDAQDAIKGAEQAASDVEQLAEEMEKKAEEIQRDSALPTSIEESIKYDWKRKPIFIAFGEPDVVFQKLDKIWDDISFGAKRKDGVPVEFPKYSPYAVARGSSVSQGYRVPEYAFKTAVAFDNWCESVGFEKGVSLEITALMTKPGHRSLI